MKPVTVRAFHRAATVSGHSAPHNTLNMKVYYPCGYRDSFEESGQPVPADNSRAPYPVVVLLSGIDQPHESLGWLAQHLAEAGMVVLAYDWVVETAGVVGLSPGIELKRLKPDRYGKKPSCPALKPLFKELRKIQKDSVLAGLLDLDRVVLGGNAVGGTMALVNANLDWFPQLRGAFSYAAHTIGSTALGWSKNSVMPLSKDLPMLIIGGNCDGVIAADSRRYGGEGWGSPADFVERSFREGIGGKRGDRHLVIINGGNHASLVWPQNNVTGRAFLDISAQGSKRKARKYLAQLIVNFCDHACTGNAMSGAELQGLANINHPLVAVAEHK